MNVLGFPGQGSQFVGMGKFLFDNFKQAKLLMEEASDTLGFSMIDLCFSDPKQQLQLTEYTQPALLCISYVYFKCLQNEKENFKFTASAGHSLGEYSALVANDVIRYSEALKLVRLRGQAMQEAVPVGEGSMLAVLKTSEEDLDIILTEALKENPSWVLAPANFNSPGQIVVSGHKKACDFLTQLDMQKLDIQSKPRFIPLKVSAPFHCSLMQPAQDKMALLLKDTQFKTSHQAIVQNLTAQPETAADKLRENLIQQVSNPVRWQQSMARLKEIGGTHFIELGPGKVLTGLVKKIDSEHWKTFNIENLDDFKSFVQKDVCD